MLTGLYLDVWAHRTLGVVETFFTVWHAMFYSGFFATGAWLAGSIMRLTRHAGARKLIIPFGYNTAVIGFAVFGAGGVFDWLWHTIRGIEQNLTALMSPPHLTLMVGGVLILSAPFRAAWLSLEDRTPSHNTFAAPGPESDIPSRRFGTVPTSPERRAARLIRSTSSSTRRISKPRSSRT